LLARPRQSRANLKANRPTTMTGDLMLPALEILIMLRPSDRQMLHQHERNADVGRHVA